MKHDKSGSNLIRTISTVAVIAALALFGTVPYFHAGSAGESVAHVCGGLLIDRVYADTQAATDLQVVSAADIDQSQCPSLDATSVLMLDAKSGEVLYEKKSTEKRDPASITKILNCLVVLDTLDLDSQVKVKINPVTEGTVMKLEKGEILTVRDLVYGMMLISGNDAAEVLAYTAGDGDIDAFCEKMNEKAVELGAVDTYYVNPNGLNYGNKHNVTTAWDIANVAVEAMKNPQFREIVGTAKYTVPATNKHKERKLKNTNRCLWDTKMKVEIDGKKRPVKYDKCIGVKTGYSSTAGDCIAGYVKDGKTEFISVVLNSPHEENKFKDSINLWNYALDRFRTYTAQKSGEVLGTRKVRGGTLREVDLTLAEDMCITINKGYKATENITTVVEISEEKVEAPVKKGDVLGRLIAYNEEGDAVKIQQLVSMEEAGVGGPLSKIGIADEDIIWFITAVTALLVIIVALIVRFTKDKKNPRRRSRRSRR